MLVNIFFNKLCSFSAIPSTRVLSESEIGVLCDVEGFLAPPNSARVRVSIGSWWAEPTVGWAGTVGRFMTE